MDYLDVYEVCLPQGFCADYLGHSAWATCPIEAVARVLEHANTVRLLGESLLISPRKKRNLAKKLAMEDAQDWRDMRAAGGGKAST